MASGRIQAGSDSKILNGTSMKRVERAAAFDADDPERCRR